MQEACEAGVPRGVALMDASYGTNSALRSEVSELGLSYVAGIVPTVKVRAVSKRGALKKRMSAKDLALSLTKHAWHTITWREGTNKRLRSRFARVRVHTAPIRGAAERTEETLLIEWPEGEDEPTRYWLSTLDKNISVRRLVDIAKMRWRIERDYQDLKQEVGLGHYEGRSWPGFHHHATLCIAIYGFLISERETIPPSETGFPRRFEMPALPAGYRPRGAANPPAAARPGLDRDAAPQNSRRDRPDSAAAVPVLRAQIHTGRAPCSMTQ
jgi:SRSO17 transposase